jgi:hypothetical protein
MWCPFNTKKTFSSIPIGSAFGKSSTNIPVCVDLDVLQGAPCYVFQSPGALWPTGSPFITAVL